VTTGPQPSPTGTSPALGLLGVPTSAGAHYAGQEAAPEALRQRDLVGRWAQRGLTVADRGDLVRRPFRVDPTAPKARNAVDVCDCIREVAEAVADAQVDGQLPVVLGGDCTITLGVVAGLKRRLGDVGLLYFDGDADLVTPATTRSGILDAMVVAHLLGEAESALTSAWGGGPLLEDDQLALLGYDPADRDSYDETIVARHPAVSLASYQDLALDPEGVARAALAQIRRPGRAVIVHFDIDAVDSGDLPLADFPHYGTGLSLAQAGRVLTALLGAPELAAVVLTEVNPTHDASGHLLDRYIDTIGDALAAALG
jgi:arginase